MILLPMSVSTKYFSYNPKTTTFTAEISDIPGGLPLGRVYDDAADEGFTLVSELTGKRLVFAQDGIDKSGEGDGDIYGWWFTCVTPGFKHFKALIIND